jgi:hypothetical protein
MTRKVKARLTAASKATARLVADSGAVTIQAGVADGESKGPATFGGVAYSGGIVSRHTLTGLKLDADYVIDLAGMESRRSVKANLDHKTSQRVGHITEVNNDQKQLSVAGALSAATSHRDEVAGSAADGFEWEVSIEASLGKPTKLARGKTQTVNGRTVEGPLYIFANSTLTGLGFVSNGADEGNAIKIAATAAGETEMTKFEKFAAKLGVDLEAASDEQKASLQEIFDAQEDGGGSGRTSSANKTIAELAKAERENNVRIEAINKLATAAMRESPMYIDQITALAELAIDNNTDTDSFELELVRACRTSGRLFTNSKSENSQPNEKVVECALSMMSGLSDIEKHYSPQVLDAVDRSGMRANFSLQQLLMQVAITNGYGARAGERITRGNVSTVLEYCFPPIQARMGGFSTVSLPGILGNVANKQILQGYLEEDQSWREIATVKNVSNFYTHTHYRMLDSLEYEPVGSGGEIKHGTLGQESYTSKARTYGKVITLTREQIINDDLSALDDVRERLGRGAAQKFVNLFWATFINNAALFPTDDSLTNYLSGATSTLLVDGVGLQLGITKFRKLASVDADGNKRVGQSNSPTILLVPPELQFVAEKLYTSGNLSTQQDDNIHRNKYKPVVQNRLSDAAFTGHSDKEWYLFGAQLKPMIVTFLNGQQTPTIESKEIEATRLGIALVGYHDFGCDHAEYLAGIKSKAAA